MQKDPTHSAQPTQNGSNTDISKSTQTFFSSNYSSSSSSTASLKNEDPEQQALIWSATKKGCQTIYLLGTQHKNIFETREVFGNAINNIICIADVVYFEHPSIEELSNFLIDNSEYTSLAYPMDVEIYQAAKNSSKICKYLETTEDLKRLAQPLKTDVSHQSPAELHENKDSKVIDMSSNCEITDLEKEKISQDLEVRYLKCDLSLSPKASSLYKIKERNELWLPKILAETNHLTLVACGALHLIGPTGLVSLLKKVGYSVVPQLGAKLIDYLSLGNEKTEKLLAVCKASLSTEDLRLINRSKQIMSDMHRECTQKQALTTNNKVT
jgi:uncharacterized protein YbaP (TraB family)